MAFHIKDPATDRAVRRLAKLKGTSLTRAVREAVEADYDRIRGRVALSDRLKPLQDEVTAIARPGGKPADKSFFDELSGDA